MILDSSFDIRFSLQPVTASAANLVTAPRLTPEPYPLISEP